LRNWEKNLNKDTKEDDNAVDPCAIGNLAERVRATLDLDWGRSTNLSRCLDRVLEVARENNVKDECIKNFHLVIFSDMQFDVAMGDEGNVSGQQEIEQKFKKAGYSQAPKVIFWNLRSTNTTPVASANYPDVAMLSGFSKGLLKKFMDIVCGIAKVEEIAEDTVKGLEDVKWW